MNIEELRKKSIEQFAMLRKNALHEAYLNAPIRSAAGASSSGGSVPLEPEYNFDMTADWTLTLDSNGDAYPITNAETFAIWLSTGKDRSSATLSVRNVVITDFKLEGNRLRCNLSGEGFLGSSDYFGFFGLGVTEVLKLGNIANGFGEINFGQNMLTTFNPIGLPVCNNYFSIEDNQLTFFDCDLSSNSIIGLNLRGNSIDSFDSSKLPSSCTTLDLSYNNLSSVSFFESTNLEYLRLGNNNISDISPTQRFPASLIELYLNDNALVDVQEEVFGLYLDNLITLDLSGNGIESITFSRLANKLESLILSNNVINLFSPGALPITLTLIDLSQNQMREADWIYSANNWLLIQPSFTSECSIRCAGNNDQPGTEFIDNAILVNAAVST